jgi:hypothetical protein
VRNRTPDKQYTPEKIAYAVAEVTAAALNTGAGYGHMAVSDLDGKKTYVVVVAFDERAESVYAAMEALSEQWAREEDEEPVG